MVELIILLLLILVVYSYTVYPLILKVLSFFLWKPYWHDYTYKPQITILISAYNEEDYISDCLKSIINCNYDLNDITILVGSDGSTDKTNEILESYKSQIPNYSPFYYNRLGKNGVLNELLKKVKTDLIFFLDADCRIEKDTINEVVKYFADKSIYGVISNLSINQKSNLENVTSFGERIYQNFEKNLREAEGNLSCVANSLGAFYAIRNELQITLPNLKLADDLYILISLGTKGKRVIFLPDVYVREERDKEEINEFKRRKRTVSGGLGAIVQFSFSMYLKYPLFGFFILSHKVIRYFMPYFLLLVFILIPFISNAFLKYTFIILFSTSILISILAYYLRKIEVKNIYLTIPYFMYGMMYSFFVGVLIFLNGNYSSKWTHSNSK
jgi:cellulose synthase/poly-beta-1,6-N-acetylglucosamine synthase-like glycosyltransferase